MRYLPIVAAFVLAALFAVAAIVLEPLVWRIVAAMFALAAGIIALIGARHYLQREHTILRNYPIIGWARWFFEFARPYLRQYIVESNTDGRPIPRRVRSLIYQRSKDIEGVVPFGTELDVNAEEYEWLNPSSAPKTPDPAHYRVDVGGPDCAKPYNASVFNISAMSFGSLGHNAIEALNLGARKGGFMHDTGEGGISDSHRKHGGDLVWELGTGYFGCRTPDGGFDESLFAEKSADEQIKMIEVKLSQGAKPGHGGVLPAAKVSREISRVRGVKMGFDVISPPAHTTFSTPIEMMHWIARLRERSGGKPVGFKLCIGHHWEFLAMCKAMLETGVTPDFITVDGSEGGTGAAPAELTDNTGTPLRDGLIFVRNALVGCGLKDRVRIAVAGKAHTAFAIAVNMALGADWCNSARGFMLSLGCVQSQKCHTNKCPTGVATLDRGRQRGLVVSEKADRVCEFHRNTVDALAMVVGAAGLEAPSDLRPHHFYRRVSATHANPLDEIYELLAPGALVDAAGETSYARAWAAARADSFAPVLAA